MRRETQSSIWQFEPDGDPIDEIYHLVQEWSNFPVRVRQPVSTHPRFKILEIMDLYRIEQGAVLPFLSGMENSTSHILIPLVKFDCFSIFQIAYDQFDFIFSRENQAVYRKILDGYEAYNFTDNRDGWAKRRYALGFEFWCRDEREDLPWWIEVDDLMKEKD